MLSSITKIKLMQLAAKYGIQITEYRAGYVQVRIAKWAKYKQQLNRIISKIEQYPEIKKIHFFEGTNTITIFYDETMFADESAIKYWLNILENELLV